MLLAALCHANPGAAGVEFSRALVSAFSETGFGRSPEAATDVLRNTASKLHLCAGDERVYPALSSRSNRTSTSGERPGRVEQPPGRDRRDG